MLLFVDAAPRANFGISSLLTWIAVTIDFIESRFHPRNLMDNVDPVDWRANESIPEGPFPTLNDAKQTLKDYAISQGFSLVIKTSDRTCTILSCSQGGVKRSHKAGGWVPLDGIRRLRTKKVGCPYEVKIRMQRNVDGIDWRTEVVSDLHAGHHQLTRYTIGSLPSARRHLSANENTRERVKELHSSGVELGALWSTLRDKHQWIQYKDVDNAVQTLKKEQRVV